MSDTLIISGGSKGIGRATISLFKAQGFRIVNLSRSPCPVDGVVQIFVDLSEPGWPDHHGEAVLAAVAGSDRICLIHNASSLAKDSVCDLNASDLSYVLQVNVVASQQLNRLLLPHLGEGSSILYLGSTLGEKAVSGACSYVVSKHAVIGLMRATCQDLVGRGIHTACICPGFTDTEMLLAHVGGDTSILQGIAAGVTFARLIEPQEIADALWFCAGAPVMNGAVIHANLGQIER